MDAGAVAAALDDARFDARQAFRHEDLADDARGPPELAEWERIAQLLAAAPAGTVYAPDADDVVQAELAADAAAADADAAAAAAREAELREAMWIEARADELQALREPGPLEQTEFRTGDEPVRDGLTRRADGYVQAEVDAWLAHAPAAHLGHYRDPAAREEAAVLLTPPVLAHATLLAELARLVPGADVDKLAFAARIATTEPEAAGALVGSHPSELKERHRADCLRAQPRCHAAGEWLSRALAMFRSYVSRRLDSVPVCPFLGSVGVLCHPALTDCH